jgi:metal-dependent amidase/aminoacylase/carboxypeptidase family protein
MVGEKLTAFGYDVTRISGTGIVGVLANGDGPVVLARAEMDALPVTEATGLPYASEVDGVLHVGRHVCRPVPARRGGRCRIQGDGR